MTPGSAHPSDARWLSELERVFDVVRVEASAGSTIYHATYWEEGGRVDLTIDLERRVADVVLKRGEATEQFQVSPLHDVIARTAWRPYRLDLGKEYGGRLTLWFGPLEYGVGGSL